VFLAALMWPLGSGDAWYHAVLLAQANLGAASAGLTVLIAARWLGVQAAITAGLMLAIWPHDIAISGFLLSESLFGFMVLLTLWQLLRAERSGNRIQWGLAGMGLGVAAMVNATLAPFGLLLGAMLWFRKAVPRRLLFTMMAGSLILPCAWGLRNSTVQGTDSIGGRAATNLVQGSWPEYHTDYIKSQFGDPQAMQQLAEIASEQQLASHALPQWLSSAALRFRSEPLHYLAWYGWKPALLWAWNIRMGFGDVYPYRIEHPIFKTSTAMRILESLCVAINPLLFVLMSIAVLMTLFRSRTLQAPVALYAVALLVAYETLVYTVLQSEPRYSIPFRSLQMILALSCCNWAWDLWRSRWALGEASRRPGGPRRENVGGADGRA
jgi:4-amino-4-deoxy-L-arabinose transferase-like glycosyltransferase